MQSFRGPGLPWSIPRVTGISQVYTRAFRRMCTPRKSDRWDIPVVYHERALYDYFIAFYIENETLVRHMKGRMDAIQLKIQQLSRFLILLAVLFMARQIQVFCDTNFNNCFSFHVTEIVSRVILQKNNKGWLTLVTEATEAES